MLLRKIVLLLLSALTAVYLGHFHFDVDTAAGLMSRWGYWMIFLVFAFCLGSLWLYFSRKLLEASATSGKSDSTLPADPPSPGAAWEAVDWLFQSFRRRLENGSWNGLCLPVFFLFSLWLVLWTSQEVGWKIVMDEPVLASTALSMHEDREASFSVSGFLLNGEYYSSAFGVDKRPLLFPFLLSLVHDGFGYSPNNAFWLNGVLLYVFLFLAFVLGRQLLSPYGGYLFSGLLATVPLLPIIATSGIFDLLNLVLMLVFVLVAGAYLRKPSPEGMNLLIVSAILLAHARYESVLFVVAAGGLILLTWWRERRMTITGTLIFAPLLLAPYLLQRKIIASTPENWHFRGDEQRAFSFDYLEGNLASAWRFFFGMDSTTANSLLLTLGFVLIAVFVGLRFLRAIKWASLFQPYVLVFAGLLMVTGINFILLMFYHWGQLEDMVATRLVLPVLLVQCFFCVGGLSYLRLGRRFQLGALLLVGLFFLLQTRPSLAQHHFFAWAVDRTYGEKVLEFAWAEAEEGDLVLSQNSLPAYLGRASCLGFDDALGQLDRIAFHFELGTFNRVHLLYLEPTPLADVENIGKLQNYARTHERILASMETEILGREKLNDALYLVHAELIRIREDAYVPLQTDLGSVSLDRLGTLKPSHPGVWEAFTASLPQ